MTENQVRLTIGALLHDVGKVIYRTGDGRNHSASGKDYLENEVGIKDNLILESIAYHHESNLKNAKIADDSYAYITYYADNIAASADRREKAEGEGGFDKKVPLASVFNILNGNSQNYHYSRQILDIENGINYPTEERVDLQEDFYKKIRQNLTDCLKQINYTEEYLNSLLAVLESNLSYIPSSTSKKEMEDISLYDHMKITAALAQCIEHYLVENQIKNYRENIDRPIAEMKYMQQKVVEMAKSVDQLMGYEGNAARIYFRTLGKLIDPEFAFTGRNRRPPLDPFNSMLSLGYSIILNEIYGKLEGKGLNPYFGMLHQDREKHPTLASDMMEEWRAVLVDTTVMGILNGHELSVDDFYSEENKLGVFLSDRAFKIYLKKLEEKFRSDNKYLSYVDYSVSFRKALDLQVNQLAKMLETGDLTLYKPVKIR